MSVSLSLRKNLLTAVAFIGFSVTAFAQTPGLIWAKGYGGTSAKYATGMAVDPSGNVYATGTFSGSIDADPGTPVVTLTSAGLSDIIISKFDVDGNFVWVKQIGGSNGEAIQAITLDGDGNLLLAGNTETSSLDVDPGAGVSTVPNSNFVLKVTPNGDFIWVRYVPSAVNVPFLDITTDASNNVLVTGRFSGTRDFDMGAGVANLVPKGGNDIFVFKIDTNGDYVWAKNMGGTATANVNSGQSIHVDAANNVFVTGYFGNTVDFDPGATDVTLTSSGNNDGFILKLTSVGNFDWVKKIGGTGSDQSQSIQIDDLGHVVVSGVFTGVANFDPGISNLTLSSQGGLDYFISRFTNSGDFLWAKRIGDGTDQFNYFSTLDGAGNIYTTGYFFSGMDVDPGAADVTLSGQGGFVSKLDNSGNFVWAIKSVDAPNDYTYGPWEIVADDAGSLYVSGTFNQTLDFDPDLCTFLLSSVSTSVKDFFVQKLSTSLPPLCIPTPTITSFTPDTGPIGTTITLTGTNFSATPANNTVAFNGVSATVTSSTATSIVTIVPAGATSGYITVTVNTKTGFSPYWYTVTTPSVPTITNFTPSNGPVGTSVTISGTNFSTIPANNQVRFNGTLATASASTATSITTTVPSGATTGTITVMVAGNTATSATNFTVTTPILPTITGFTPLSGPVGISVVITGTNFSATTGNNIVRFNGATATVSSGTTTSLTAVVPAAASTGPITVSVGANTATSATNFTLTVPALPTITSFTPGSGPVGTSVIISGTNFSATTSNNIVRFNGATATVSSGTTTSLTVVVPATATTGLITVTVGGNTATSATNFIVTVPALPTITSFSPASGPIGTSVTITGTNFSAAPANNTVRFNGTLTTVTASSTTSITTTVPANATTGPITVLVDGNTATSGTNFTVVTNVPPVITPTVSAVPVEGVVTVALSSLIRDPDGNLDLTSLSLLSSTSQQGALASLTSNQELVLDYQGIFFTGTDYIQIRVCDLEDKCSQQLLAIEVGGDIIVYNAVSPNADDKNDIFFLQYIDLFEDTQNNLVTIFNRWGDVVFEARNYNNTDRAFTGLSDNGKELPSGTYYYKINFNSGRKLKTGYLSLKR